MNNIQICFKFIINVTKISYLTYLADSGSAVTIMALCLVHSATLFEVLCVLPILVDIQYILVRNENLFIAVPFVYCPLWVSPSIKKNQFITALAIAM